MSLRFEKYEILSADLGRSNPLPDIGGVQDVHAAIAIDTESVTPEESKYMGWARVKSILPYTIQDGYNRIKQPKAWNAAILENEYLKAVFLPELGGRLWSLYDKKEGRELLHKNPVFQPCNLALRNAWFSGGVEWNCGIIGHTPYTCDQMYCEELAMDDGTPVVRMYQYERVRGLVYRVEAFLPEESDRLYVRIRIDNTRQEPTAVYWWSNMAVDEREDVRVLVPAAKAFRYGYGGKLAKIPVPHMDGMDVSYTMQLPHAMDFFFDLNRDDEENYERPQRRWVSAIGGDGHGFIQTSTDALQSRKLFVWGMNAGGRNWQTFLSKPGSQYLEIQAGLAHTQLEHLPMEPGATISWLEAYGAIKADPTIVHDPDWEKAWAEVDTELEKACPRDTVEAWLKRCEKELDGKNGELKQYGPGWACLEQKAWGDAFDARGLRFPEDMLGEAERQWISLLESGSLAEPDPMEEPLGYQIGDHWAERLQAGDENWYSTYQLGVYYAYKGDVETAAAYWKKSAELRSNPWALRCLGIVEQQNGDMQKAADVLVKAVKLVPEVHIAKEAMNLLKDTGRYEEMMEIYEALPEAVRKNGRVLIASCEAFIETGRYEEAEAMLLGDIALDDVKEGEVKLSDLWFSLCAHKEAEKRGTEYNEELLKEIRETVEVPAKLDFRMH